MMRHDEDIERVIKSSPEVDERWKQVELEWAAEHRLVALAGSDALTQAILADGVNNQLGHGAFSRKNLISASRASALVIPFERSSSSGWRVQ